MHSKSNVHKYRLLLTILLMVGCKFTSIATGQTRLDSLLTVLDQTIDNEKQYASLKSEQISKLTLLLDNKYLPKEERYNIYRDLSREYDAYMYDSAKVYSEKSAKLAATLNMSQWVNESQIQLGLIHARAGMFQDAIAILNSIDKRTLTQVQLFYYYKTYSDTYIYWIEYLDGLDITTLVMKRIAYQDSLLKVVRPNTYEYAINYGTYFIEKNEFVKAEKLLLDAMPQVKRDTRDYSVMTAILAYLYEVKKQPLQQREYLTLSAISDVKASIKENNSLRLLAILLYDDGKIDRANHYIKKCLEDANYYHARLRNIQTSKVLPIIDQAYQKDRERQQNNLKLLLIVVSLLSGVLLLAIYLVFRQMKKVSKAQKEILSINAKLNTLNEDLHQANDEQKRTNIYLGEANLIKEQYIGSFLEITTEYIDKFDTFKTMVNRKIMAGQKNDILRLTAESEDSIRDLKKLYESFDKAFLNIYPNFVEELNKLLREEEQYPVVSNTLNQELRIFAMIRLGISDSNKMATFLHYSLRTIYNYRSKVKSKAISQDENFEERVKHICTISTKAD